MGRSNSFTDQELLLLIAENNREAFEVIYRRYWNELYHAAHRRLKNTSQAEDIVQNIFVDLWLRRGDCRIRNLSAYLHTAVRYNIYNFIARDSVNNSFYEPFETIAAYPAGGDAWVIEKELVGLVNAYLATLPKKRYLIFSLYFNGNLSTEEIAKRLKISRKTVQNQLNTAMNGLRASLLPLLLLCLFLLQA